MGDRIVCQLAPEQIILFGSYARGEQTAGSDVDRLVVMPVSGSKREAQLEIRTAFRTFDFPKDVLISRPEEFEWRKNVVGTIEWPATREGKVLYAKP